MCTLFIYRSENTEWPVFIANNRDEYFTRSFKEPHTHWVNNSNIFAGKDLLKGGSWLGINKSGLCVSILNRNSMVIKKDNLESRGNIVLNALKYNNARDALNNIKKSFKRNTKFFNLIILDYKNAFWIKYDYAQLKVSNIPYGYSIIDNYDLNDNNSTKQNLYKNIFKNKRIPNPKRNYFKDWKEMLFLKKKYKKEELSSVYVEDYDNNYGTVCSSIIGLPNKEKINNNIIWLYSEKKYTFKNLSPFKI